MAGVIAAHTVLPVIGIPVPTDLQGGLDSLLSMVQMPGDVPVATVGVGERRKPVTPAFWQYRCSPWPYPSLAGNTQPTSGHSSIRF